MIHVPSPDGKPVKYVDIAFDVAATHLDRFHIIFTDRLYTSIELATRLLTRHTYLTGAIRTNATGLPVDMSPNPSTNRTNLQAIVQRPRTERGTFYVRQNAALTFTIWNDSTVLHLLSSPHNGYRNEDGYVTR